MYDKLIEGKTIFSHILVVESMVFFSSLKFNKKNIKNTTDRLELKKYCSKCQKHTAHKEKK